MNYYAGIGARTTPQEIQSKMSQLASELEKIGWILRSGGAIGADHAFESGCSNREIFLASDATAKAMEIAKKFHPSWYRLPYGVKKLMARNVMVILGRELDAPVKMVVCWTENAKPIGGTGHALRVAHAHGIPIYNLANLHDFSRISSFLEKSDKTA